MGRFPSHSWLGDGPVQLDIADLEMVQYNQMVQCNQIPVPPVPKPPSTSLPPVLTPNTFSPSPPFWYRTVCIQKPYLCTPPLQPWHVPRLPGRRAFLLLPPPWLLLWEGVFTNQQWPFSSRQHSSSSSTPLDGHLPSLVLFIWKKAVGRRDPTHSFLQICSLVHWGTPALCVHLWCFHCLPSINVIVRNCVEYF